MCVREDVEGIEGASPVEELEAGEDDYADFGREGSGGHFGCVGVDGLAQSLEDVGLFIYCRCLGALASCE